MLKIRGLFRGIIPVKEQMLNIVNSNRYRVAKNAITYSIFRTGSGYEIQAFVPEHTSSTDRLKVVQWFRTYRDSVRRENPLLSVRFHNLEHGYGLEIKPCKSCRPIDEDGELVKRILQESLSNA